MNQLLESIEITSDKIFNEDDFINNFEKTLELWNNQIKKPRYNIILKYLNIWLKPYNINLKKISNFKNIDRALLLSNEDHNKLVLNTYSEGLYKYLKIKKIDYSKFPYKDSSEIINFLENILRSIEFSLVRNVNKNNCTLSIIPRKLNHQYSN